MLMAGMICLLVATLILAVGVLFTKGNKPLSFLLQTLSFISLICLGLVAGNFQNNFSGFTILLILSIAPQFLTLIDLNEYIDTKKNELPAQNVEINSDDKKSKKNSEHYFFNSNGEILKSISTFLSAFCIAMSALYLGLESYQGFGIGVGIAFAMTFVMLIIKKHINPFDLISMFLLFLSAGIMLGQIVMVLMYSFAITNILFSIGSLVFAVFSIFTVFSKKNYVKILYFLAMFCLLATIII